MQDFYVYPAWSQKKRGVFYDSFCDPCRIEGVLNNDAPDCASLRRYLRFSMYKKRAEHAKNRNEMQLCRDFVGISLCFAYCSAFHVVIY